jgi:hypothetical protein
MSELTELSDRENTRFTQPLIPESSETASLDNGLLLESIHRALAEIDALSENSVHSREWLEKVCYSRLPDALFHATTKDKAERIKEDGLNPSKLQYEDRKVVSLSDTVAYAKFCASQTNGVDPTELVILEVTTQGIDRENFESYLAFADPHDMNEQLHEVHSIVPISPDWIHRLTPEDVVQLESNER